MYKEAEKLCKQVIEGSEKMIGLNEVILDNRATLADIHIARWDNQSATELYQQAYDGAKSTLGTDRPLPVRFAAKISPVKSMLALQSIAKDLGIWPSSTDKKDLEELAPKLKLVETAAQELQDRGDNVKGENILLAAFLVRGIVFGLANRDGMKTGHDIRSLY